MKAETTRANKNSYVLEVRELKKWYKVQEGFFGQKPVHVKAVDGVSFNVKYGETLSVVGESGCGKSTVGMSILRLIEPTSGQVILKGKDITNISKKELREIRKDMQVIIQDPFGSLNPRMTVGDIIKEPLDIHKMYSSKERNRKVAEIMELVGLDLSYVRRYPHEFSGGQRQRIGIARALVLEPEIIICDEPVSALDVSIQAQILNLMKKLQREMGIAYLFISHDLGVVKHISHRVAVMYLGRIVEMADKHELYNNPLNPYTKALLSAIPVLDPDLKKEKILLEGDLPSPINPPQGCHFSTRCLNAKDICRNVEPTLRDVGNGHLCACHFVV